MMEELIRITGADLVVGDIVHVWWKPRWIGISRIDDYTGSLPQLEGARIATFGDGRRMTIEKGMVFAAKKVR